MDRIRQFLIDVKQIVENLQICKWANKQIGESVVWWLGYSVVGKKVTVQVGWNKQTLGVEALAGKGELPTG